jgi:predicted dehydrogenase
MHNTGVAVVGTGFIGPVHVEALRRLGICVTGVLGSSAAKSDAAAKSIGLPRGYARLDDVLADPAVNAVHVATPNVQHYDMSKRVLAAGKHLLCEKPLGMTSKETAELVRLAADARRRGVAAGVCYNIRFYPLNLEARERVRSHEVGDVLAVNGSYVQDWLLYDTDYNWRVLAESGGALRAVADIGTHWIDLVTSIGGLTVESVCADLATFHKTRHRPTGEVETFTGRLGKRAETQPVAVTTEDYGSILFRFTNGARGSLWVSQVTAGRKNTLRWELSGTKRGLAWDSERPNELWVGRRDAGNELLPRDPSLLSDAVRPYANYPGGHNEGFPDTFKQLFRAFYGYVAAGDFSAQQPFPTFEDGHREVVLCEAIFASNREGRWVQIG